MSFIDWKNWGLIKVIGDYVLSNTQGDIVELGMGYSTSVITELAIYYNRKAYHCDKNPEHLKLITADKERVFIGTTDEFFSRVQLSPIAFAFIDAWHEHKQVRRDFYNVFSVLVDNGYILLHDTYPYDEEHTSINYCYNSYLFRQWLEEQKNIDCHTFVWDGRPNVVSNGITITRKKPNNLPEYQR